MGGAQTVDSATGVPTGTAGASPQYYQDQATGQYYTRDASGSYTPVAAPQSFVDSGGGQGAVGGGVQGVQAPGTYDQTVSGTPAPQAGQPGPQPYTPDQPQQGTAGTYQSNTNVFGSTDRPMDSGAVYGSGGGGGGGGGVAPAAPEPYYPTGGGGGGSYPAPAAPDSSQFTAGGGGSTGASFVEGAPSQGAPVQPAQSSGGGEYYYEQGRGEQRQEQAPAQH